MSPFAVFLLSQFNVPISLLSQFNIPISFMILRSFVWGGNGGYIFLKFARLILQFLVSEPVIAFHEYLAILAKVERMTCVFVFLIFILGQSWTLTFITSYVT